jgi:hypothetical protein
MRPLTSRSRLLLACALAVAVVAGVVFAMWPKEPVYEGKPLSYWLDQFPWVFVNSNSDISESILVSSPSPRVGPAPQKAVEALGAQCLPTLLHRLQTRDNAITGWKRRARGWAVILHLMRQGSLASLPADVKRGQAVLALVQLGDVAKPILPDVVSLAKSDPDPGVRASALEVVRRLSPGDHSIIRRSPSRNSPNMSTDFKTQVCEEAKRLFPSGDDRNPSRCCRNIRACRPAVPNNTTRPDNTTMVQQPSREVPAIFISGVSLGFLLVNKRPHL